MNDCRRVELCFLSILLHSLQDSLKSIQPIFSFIATGILCDVFKRILVPYDNSVQADNAVKHAVDIAHTDSEIILVKVVPEIPSNPLVLERPVRTKTGETMLLSDYVKQLYEQMRVHAKEQLEEKIKGIPRANVRTIVLIGDSIADKIVELAEKEHVDLIVIGNVGLSGLSKLKALGSVSRAVSERASCPVMIVR